MPSDTRPAPSPQVRPSQRSSTFSSTRSTSNSVAGSFAGSVKQTTKDAMNADVPLGAWAAAAQTTAKAPTIGDIRQGSFSNNGWTSEGQMEANEGRMHRASSDSSGKVYRLWRTAEAGTPQVDSVDERHEAVNSLDGSGPDHQSPAPHVPATNIEAVKQGAESINSTGWRPPPKPPWTKSWAIGLKAFGKWAIKPFGFLVTLYCLNVVAWGGMLFLLLCGAAPAMCWAPVGNGEYVRNCNHIDSPRRIWLEIDSQILNGLFCVTGFGLLPWRARDLYYLLKWRFCSEEKHGRDKKLYGFRKLAGFYKGWVRLPGSDTLSTLSLAEYNARTATEDSKIALTEGSSASIEAGDAGANDPRLPLPPKKTPDPPLTGVRAPPTKLWKLDFYIWCNMWNTFFQACLCGFMWGLNRYDRPSWSTGFFIACACVISGVGGYVTFKEGKKIKRVEGANPSPEVMRKLEKMQLRKDGLELTGTNETTEVPVQTNGKGRGV